jgi:hypothetical protein
MFFMDDVCNVKIEKMKQLSKRSSRSKSIVFCLCVTSCILCELRATFCYKLHGEPQRTARDPQRNFLDSRLLSAYSFFPMKKA